MSTSSMCNQPTLVASYPYQSSPAFYYPQQAMPMIQQPMYVTEPTAHGSSPAQVPTPMMVQPVVMTPTAFGQVAYNIAPAASPPTQTNPVYIYNPHVVMNPPSPQQMEFTVEETSAWLHELCVMRRWNEEADVYKNIFLRNNICGNKMKVLTYKDLTVLGIKESHREELLEAISQAFEEQTNFYQQSFVPATPTAIHTSAHMQPMCVTPTRSETTPFHVKESETMSTISDACGTDNEMQISDEDESSGWVRPQNWTTTPTYRPEQTGTATVSSRSPSPGRSGFGRTRVEETPMSYARVVGGSRKMDVSQTSDDSTSEVVAPKKKKKLMPRPKNPMPYHVLMTLKMKTGRSLQSTYIGHVTKDTVVWVNTVRGRRARIVEKTETGTKNLGWVSLRLEDGKPLLVQEQEYLANPSLYPIRDSETGSPIDGA